ncbi:MULTISPECIES: LysR family transcriptional regulator [Streptosporangium]|uniref:DNA-binding transcriptional LysR family regulator n=1 Tax=Streptosporangium brasiliense TaxID=47480 RepID=A0ABT9RJC0_9ACTN|nr:LysR family transcriptional regulator [Streptosporangium brasiliense]MDP9869398.1 DNA-binding transcriptional LysR family regulator [Streptosporangium brasiliense]
MDLNLLTALDALLHEVSVTRAAERLGTSPAAASRKLATLRRVLGDPLLVRAGQRLVPTPRALELREEVRTLLQRSEALLAPAPALDLAQLRRTFTIQTSDLLLTGLGAPLMERINAQAPQADVVFAPEALEGGPALRQGEVDIELGVLGDLDPEIRIEPLARVAMVAVAREDHPLFAEPITPQRFAQASHIGISRRGRLRGPIDAALAKHGLRRRVAAVVPGHTTAMMLTATSDLVCLTIDGWLGQALTALGLRAFPIPLDVPPMAIGMAWHPRHAADQGHTWLRCQLRMVTSSLVESAA